MIEVEEAVELAESVEQQLQLSEKAQRKQVVRLEPRFPLPPEINRPNQLAEALADPNVSPGAHTAEILRHHRDEAIRQREAIAAQARNTVTHGAPEQRIKLIGQQPEAASFLSRDYHSAGCSRFLFSTADEYDGYAANKGSGWNYSLPEPAGGSSSHNNS